MKLEEMYKKGFISHKKYEIMKEDAEQKEKAIEEIYNSITKDDRIIVELVNPIHSRWDNKELQIVKCEVEHVYNGYILENNGTDRNGKTIQNYITKKFADENNCNYSESDRCNYLKCKRVTQDEYKMTVSINIHRNNIKDIRIGINKKYDKWIQKAVDYANLNAEDDDIVYKAINKYKVLRELDDNKKDMVYNMISVGLWG